MIAKKRKKVYLCDAFLEAEYSRIEPEEGDSCCKWGYSYLQILMILFFLDYLILQVISKQIVMPCSCQEHVEQEWSDSEWSRLTPEWKRVDNKNGEQPWPQLICCALICCCMYGCAFQEDWIYHKWLLTICDGCFDTLKSSKMWS